MLGGEGDPLDLSGIDCQRIQPERLPAVIEPVQQPEVMAMEMEYGGDDAAIGQSEHHGTAGRGAERRRRGSGEIRRPHPVALRSAERQLEALGAPEIELGRQAIGRQRRRGGQDGVPHGRLAGDDHACDRPGLLAVVQEDKRGGTGRRACVDEGVGPASRRQHDRAVPRRERLGGLAIQGHDPHLVPVHFDRNDSPLAAIDEPEP